MLADYEKHFLLKVARCVIESAANGTPAPEFSTDFPSLLQPQGAFVTLRIGDELRGCIGYVDAPTSLWETVREVAAKAALEDLRFLPLTTDELPKVWIEISVLGPLQPIVSCYEIEIGVHGVMLEFGKSRGLLLPQVAVEYAWDSETFLLQAARKAGLNALSWKDPGTRMYTFTAQVFSERAMAPQGMSE